MLSGLCCSRLSLEVSVPSVHTKWSEPVPSLWDADTWYIALMQCSQEDIWKEAVEPTFWVMGGEVERRQASHRPCLPEVSLIWCRKSSVDKRMRSYSLGIRYLSD